MKFLIEDLHFFDGNSHRAHALFFNNAVVVHVTAWRITLSPAPTIHFKWTTFPKTIIGSENAINRFLDRYL